MSRSIIYNGWSAAPGGIVGRLGEPGKSRPGLLAQFGLADAKLYFVLADACKHVAEVRVSNAELMKATGLDNRSLRRARKNLHEKFKVIEATPADARQENYTYRVFKSAPTAKPEPVKVAIRTTPPTEVNAVPIPDDVLHTVLSNVPSLEGKSSRTETGWP